MPHHCKEPQNPFLSTALAKLAYEKRFIDIAKLYKTISEEKRKLVYGIMQGIAFGIGLDVEKVLEKK